MRKTVIFWAVALVVIATTASADVVIPMTTIGDVGNAADWTALGSVNYIYQIGTYEVTVAQYTAFLNSAAASDPYGLYDETMATGPLGSFIERSGTDGSYSYTATAGTENQPVRNTSFYDSIRFCNWLANGQGSGDTETGSYTLADGITLTRTENAAWVIPSEDEWYKAAYYDPVTETYYTYPNGSDDVPAEPVDSITLREMNFGDDPYWNPDGGDREYYTQIGETTGHTPYGVYDMGGNVQEWTDTMVLPANRITRGGHLFDPASDLRTVSQDPADPTTDGDLQGFRVAYLVPEPSTFLMLTLGGLGLFLHGRKRKQSFSARR